MATRQTSTQKDQAAKAALDEVSEQIATLREDLAGLTEAMADYGVARGQLLAGQASDAAKEVTGQARDAGRAQLRRASAQAEGVQAQAEDFVTRQPELALGIATGIGFLVGLWAARR